MKINIKSLKTYVINLKEDEKRRISSKDALNKAGIYDIKFFPAEKYKPSRTGLAITFKKLFKEIENHDNPILICEDDILFNEDFNINEIDIPDNADALYIGISKYGRISFINPYVDSFGNSYLEQRNKTYNEDLVVARVDDNLYRIYNMLTAHAIIMVNHKYTKFLHDAIDIAILGGGHQDIVRAVTMPFWNVYALNNPIFYQSSIETNITNFKISELKNKNISYNISHL
jgi:GR25 family glycosyltransferase involved in LPS biosynthesis